MKSNIKRNITLVISALSTLVIGYPGFFIFLVLFLEPQLTRAADYFMPATTPPEDEEEIRKLINELHYEVRSLKEKVNQETLKRSSVRGGM